MLADGPAAKQVGSYRAVCVLVLDTLEHRGGWVWHVYFSVSSHQLALTIWAGQSLLEVLSACMVLYRVRATFTGTSGERNHEQEVERERLGQRVVGALLVLLAAYTVAHSIDSLHGQSCCTRDDSVGLHCGRSQHLMHGSDVAAEVTGCRYS
jgi:hypothetical protein